VTKPLRVKTSTVKKSVPASTSRKIAFDGEKGSSVWKIYVISSDGGPPQELIPGEQQFDPSWASDGKSLVFGTFPGAEGGQVAIRLFDLETGKISKLPNSDGLFSPRCSPAGRYIAALTADHHDLMIFDLQSKSWRRLTGPDVNSPSFSRHYRKIKNQFLASGNRMAEVDRLRDHTIEFGGNLGDRAGIVATGG